MRKKPILKMGKRIIQQRRGKGGPRYLAPGHRYFAPIGYAQIKGKSVRGEVIDIINSVAHSAPLMMVLYENGQASLLPAPLGIRKGQTVWAGDDTPASLGSVVKLAKIPIGTFVYNIEKVPECGGNFVRSSGSTAQVTGREDGQVIITLPSRKTIWLNPGCRATIGVVAGGGRPEKPFIKAGRAHIAALARGKLHPKVHGVAMNPPSHPHGGTHRRTKGGPTSVKHNAPPGQKVGLLAPKKTGRGK